MAQVYAAMGRVDEAVRKIARATARSDHRSEFMRVLDEPPPNKISNYLLDMDMMVHLLGFRMRLLAAQGLTLEALDTYYELAGLKKPAADDPLVALAGQLTEQIRGPGELRGQIQIGEEGGWAQHLSRSHFTIERVRDGTIRSLYLQCESDSMALDYVPGERWTVPEGWAPCRALVAAEAGTRFQFVELPDQPQVIR